MIPEKPEHTLWTDDQWKAIKANGQEILVAAAAGSGKTAVLVERIIQKILDPESPLDVDELLVVTFTNASAQEMRHRIGQALEKAIDERPGSDHLRRQLTLLNSASISTLHSFCLEVIRKYYYMIDIDPGFRIADATEADLLRDEVLEELFEEEYGKEGNEPFYRLVDTFTNDRSDKGLQSLVLKLYDFSRSHPEPEEWLRKLIDLYDVTETTRMADLPFIDVLTFDIELTLASAKQSLEEALELAKVPGGPAPRAANYESDIAIVDDMLQAAGQSWESLYEKMNGFSFSRAKACKGDEYVSELVKQADDLRKKAKAQLEKLAGELFGRKPESFLRDMRAMKPVLESLIEVIIKFSKKFNDMKTEKGLVDFSDLEHLALQILGVRSESGNLLQSEVAEGYRRKFKEILIDEFQDVNMVQETITRLVATGGEQDGNVFMVGDVKQSIYRFRLAEPNLFLGKYRRFTPDGENTGLRIDLSRNFRSRRQILAGTNYLFRQMMGVRVGEIEYDEAAELVKGSGYPEDERFSIELAIIDQANEEEKEAESVEGEFDAVEMEQSRLEATYIAQKIRALVDGQFPVYDVRTGTERPIKYQDIVILLRSMPWAADIMEECKHAGIPVYANLSTGYFDATEVTLMLSLLKVIDNPDQDIPLASILRSPIVGLSEEELAMIRLQSKRGSYYQATKQFLNVRTEPRFVPAQRKLARLFEQLADWRNLARTGALSQLIWQLYRDTGFYEFAGGLPGGKQRQANLRALYDRARQYEETSFRGLFRFLRFIDRMRERGNDLGAARALGEQEDVVRLMTIHSSKGLEFPVVFVAGLARKFNMMDINSGFLFDKDLGFASKYIDVEKRISYPSLPQMAFRRKKKLELLAEEMRVLYVAMTRAKEKLFMVGTIKDAEKEIKKWANTGNHSGWLLQDSVRAAATSYLDWIWPAIGRHREGACLQLGTCGSEEVFEDASRWKVEILSKSLFEAASVDTEQIEDDWLLAVRSGKEMENASPVKEEVISRLSWAYSHPLATRKMSKQSVSEIKRMMETRDEASATSVLVKDRTLLYDRPKFMQSRTLSPSERGTAMHTVMQHLPLAGKPSFEEIEKQLDELMLKEILTEEQCHAISIEQIVEFFETDLGNSLLTAGKVWREVPFTMGLPADEVYKDWDGEDESVLVQGIIDCIIETGEGLLLLDYKTDAITGRFPGGFEQAKPHLENRYRVQIELYKRAIQEIWKKPVLGAYLYFFDGGYRIEL